MTDPLAVLDELGPRALDSLRRPRRRGRLEGRWDMRSVTVAAPTIAWAHNWAHEHGLDRRRLAVITRLEQLRGLDGVVIHMACEPFELDRDLAVDLHILRHANRIELVLLGDPVRWGG